MDRKTLERWLAERGGRARCRRRCRVCPLFTAMPRVEATPAFVEQRVTAAWRWRARRRRLIAFGWASRRARRGRCSGSLSRVAAPGAGVDQGARLRERTRGAVAGRLHDGAMNWWLTLAHVGGVVASALVTPARAAALVGSSCLGYLRSSSLAADCRRRTLWRCTGMRKQVLSRSSS